MASPWSTPKKRSDYVLTEQDRDSLENIGAKLKPLFRIGKEGIAEHIIAKTNAELTKYQIIKIEFIGATPKQAKEQAVLLAEKTLSECISRHGNTAVFFRKHPNRNIERLKDRYR